MIATRPELVEGGEQNPAYRFAVNVLGHPFGCSFRLVSIDIEEIIRFEIHLSW